MGFGTIGMVLFWVVVILAIVGLASVLARGRSGGGGTSERIGATALEILDERYARGEIDQTEYERKRRDLTG
jgi:putative membrane protein